MEEGEYEQMCMKRKAVWSKVQMVWKGREEGVGGKERWKKKDIGHERGGGVVKEVKSMEDDKRGGKFFFSSRRRHTRLMRDWSSDVCSSDLHGQLSSGSA